jgi:NAD(P)H dehydrogenase (quinone)
MLSFTSGCFPGMMEPDGLLGQRDVILWHLQHGTFGYSGLQVLEPFVGWSIQYTDEARRGVYLAQYEARLRGIEHEEPMPAHGLADFDADWRLKPGIAPRTAGHRRPPLEG